MRSVFCVVWVDFTWRNGCQIAESIDAPERAKNVKDLSFNEFPTDSVLGVHWNVEMDTVGFQIKAQNYKPTRRNILSVISSVFGTICLTSKSDPTRSVLQGPRLGSRTVRD
jgi:hypothetical protein